MFNLLSEKKITRSLRQFERFPFAVVGPWRRNDDVAREESINRFLSSLLQLRIVPAVSPNANE